MVGDKIYVEITGSGVETQSRLSANVLDFKIEDYQGAVLDLGNVSVPAEMQEKQFTKDP